MAKARKVKTGLQLVRLADSLDLTDSDRMVGTEIAFAIRDKNNPRLVQLWDATFCQGKLWYWAGEVAPTLPEWMTVEAFLRGEI